MSTSSSLEIAKRFLNKEVEVIIDRPLGTKHSEHGFTYEVNYGFIAGVLAPDGEEIDAYYLGVDQPVEKATGLCVAIAHRRDNDDDKLIVLPKDIKMTDEQILSAIKFQERWFDTVLIRNKETQGGERRDSPIV